MNDIVRMVASLSISGSFMALILLVGESFFQKNISKACSYYIWILVLLKLTIPLSFDQSIMNQLYHSISSDSYIKNEKTIDNATVQDDALTLTDTGKSDEILTIDPTQKTITENNHQTNIVVKQKTAISVQDILVVIWLIGSCIALLLFMIPYIQLKQKIKGTNVDPAPEDMAVLHKLCDCKRIQLKYNEYVSTPMLIGIMSPCIVIPGCNYVTTGKKQELENILYHELMHYKRKDLMYKWFVVMVSSLHWFNPLMIPIRHQISRTCELSCDEAVIRHMNTLQKQSYGETLLSMAAEKKISAGGLATTLCEEKKEIEERLLSIMRYKKQTIGMLLLSIFIIVMLAGCGMLLGSATKADKTSASIKGEGSVSNSDGNIDAVINTEELKWYGATELIPKGTVLPDTMVNSNDAMNDFYYSNRTIALLAVLAKEDIYLYGLKENGGTQEDPTFYCHGICIRQGNEIQVVDVDWGIYGDIPQIQYQDYDEDGQKELALILKSAGGTDLSLMDLHIFEKSPEGGLIDHHFTDWADQLSNLVTYEADENGTLKLYVRDEQIERMNLTALEEEWGEKFQKITFGNNVDFSFEDGKLYLHVLPAAIVGNWVTPQIITDTYIQMEVQYHGGFELKNRINSDSNSIDRSSTSEEKLNKLDTEKVDEVISNNYHSVFEGSIGKQRISMAIYRTGDQLTASYITQNDDDGEINLQGTIQINTASFVLFSEDKDITLKGTIKPDTVEGEVLEGTYTESKNQEESMFNLSLSHGIGDSYEHRYPSATSGTKEIEAFARNIKLYVKDNKKQALAELVEYPINVTVNNSKVSIDDAKEFEQNYDKIFKADFKERISNCYSKYLFSNYMGIMLGNGEVWFGNVDDKRLRIIAINN